ncbi:MAG: TnpV protein [Anaerolineales bacterium]|nr:TnpV protein [Anaerolineales bacterium]
MCGIDVTARERWERVIGQMMKAEGVTEDLKAHDAMEG